MLRDGVLLEIVVLVFVFLCKICWFRRNKVFNKLYLKLINFICRYFTCVKKSSDSNLELFYRALEYEQNPAELLTGRKLRATLPSIDSNQYPEWLDFDKIKNSKIERVKVKGFIIIKDIVQLIFVSYIGKKKCGLKTYVDGGSFKRKQTNQDLTLSKLINITFA